MLIGLLGELYLLMQGAKLIANILGFLLLIGFINSIIGFVVVVKWLVRKRKERKQKAEAKAVAKAETKLRAERKQTKPQNNTDKAMQQIERDLEKIKQTLDKS